MSEHHIPLAELAKARAGGSHSIFSASSSPLWLNCSGGLIPNLLAQDEGSPEAAYGTVAHEITEQWLKAGKPPRHRLGKLAWVPGGEWGYAVEIDEEMFGYVQECVDRCEWLPGQHLVETHVSYDHLTPIKGQGGTLDFAAIHGRTAYVIDHKFGSSPENVVFAEENPQLMLYAIGLWGMFPNHDLQEFSIRINQPRLNHFDEWVCSAKRLREFEQYVRERAHAAWQHDAPRSPGAKQCRWCKVAASCTANAAFQVRLTDAVFSDTTITAEDMRTFQASLTDELDPFALRPSDATTLTTEHLAKLRPFRSMAEGWWSAVDEELERRALAGEKVPGYKLVEARSHRKFINDRVGHARLVELGLTRDKIISESLCSPAQAEKLLRTHGYKPNELQALLADVVVKPRGKPTLAPEHDKRPAIEDETSGVFSDETVNQEEL